MPIAEKEYLRVLNDLYEDMFAIKAGGRYLSIIGATCDIKRRILEPDFIYRKRLLKFLTSIPNDNMSDVSIAKMGWLNRVMGWINRVKWG